MKRRFMSAGKCWKSGSITLTREGREFDTETEADLIKLIEQTNVGGCVIEVPCKDALDKSFVDVLKGTDAFQKALEDEIARKTAVEPLSEPDIAKEKAAAEELKKERKAEEAEEQRIIDELKAKREEATPKVIKDFKAKSTKVQKKKA